MFLHRPFATVEGQGFKALAAKLVAIGAKYGNIDLDDSLPCARTVSRHLVQMAATQRQSLTIELRTLPRIAVTSDMWTHEATNTPYITVTAHYINEGWKLCGKILATRQIEGKKTSENIRVVVRGILDEFGVDRSNNVYVTDNGANIKAAFSSNIWVLCAGHNLNLAVSHALDAKEVEDEPLATIRRHATITDLITTCKEIVTRVKCTEIQSKLETSLKQVPIIIDTY